MGIRKSFKKVANNILIMFGLYLLITLLLVFYSNLNINTKTILALALLTIFLENYNLITYEIPINYNHDVIQKTNEVIASCSAVIDKPKEDPRKRMKIRDITVADDFTPVKYEESTEATKVVDALGKVENKEVYLPLASATAITPATTDSAKIASANTSPMDDLEAKLMESMNLHRASSNMDGDLRLMNRSTVQGQRDLNSNRVRQHSNNNRRTKNYFEEELEREENKIWWENRDSDYQF